MEIEELNYGAVAVVRPIGALTQDDAERLKTQMLEVRVKSLGRLVLDASNVPFIDSRGLEVLVEVSQQLTQTGQALKIAGVNDVLREVFELTELTCEFEHFADVNSAVRSFL